jgi:hypothetical protein
MSVSVEEWLDTPVGNVPRVSTRLDKQDLWNNMKVRLAFNRMDYKVEPGIYAVGNPDAQSAVLVSCNYKLSFDALRKELSGLDAWLLVIDTKGVNVWCAAGKGTFSTAEIVNRVKLTQLEKLVDHRRLVVPQLGAPGVAAHEVKQESGFSVIYGPVRAADIPAFLEARMKATPEMRRVKFTVKDRLILTPAEAVQGFKILLFIIAVFFILSGINSGGYSVDAAGSAGLRSSVNLGLAYIAGVFLGPLLLPWLPARRFFVKGIYAGLAMFVVSYFSHFAGVHWLETAAWLLLVPALSSFIVMNFTGASTYTSLSGVRKEMKLGVPIQAVAGVLGMVFWLAGRFV